MCIRGKKGCSFAVGGYWYTLEGGHRRLWAAQTKYLSMVRALVEANPEASIPPPTWAGSQTLGHQPKVSPYFDKPFAPFVPMYRTLCITSVHNEYEAYAAENTDAPEQSYTDEDLSRFTQPAQAHAASKRSIAEVSPTPSEKARAAADSKKQRVVGFAGTLKDIHRRSYL